MFFKSFLLLSFLFSTTNTIDVASQFPNLSGETLDGKALTIPADCGGKKTIVGMAYSQKAQEAMMTWYEPAFEKFVSKVGMFDYQYDVNLYFVPMFIGLNQAMYESTLKDLRKQNRRDLFPYVVFYKGEFTPYETSLSMQEKSSAHIFVLNEKGEVIHSAKGAYSEKKMEEIEAALSN